MAQVSKRLRFEILTRDGHTCRYCGGQAPDVKLTVDHVMPVTLGGSSEPSNLVAACHDCNAGKSSVPPDAERVAEVSTRAEEWAAAVACMVERRRDDILEMREHVQVFDDAWCIWTCGVGDDRELVPRSADWRESVEVWIARGLDVDMLCHHIEKAMTAPKVRDAWRYYCGIIWKVITAIDEEAQWFLENERIG